MRLAEKKKKRLDSYMPCGAMALTLKLVDYGGWHPIPVSILIYT